MTPASPNLSPRLLPVISLATIISSMLVAVLTARAVEPTLLRIWNIIEFVLGNLLVSGTLGLLVGLLALWVMRWPLWLRIIVTVLLGTIHGTLWHSVVASIFEARLANVLVPLPVWVLSGVGGLVVGLVLIPTLAVRCLTLLITRPSVQCFAVLALVRAALPRR